MSEVKLLLGADPEVFAKDASGRYVSVHASLPGTKENPYRVPNGAVQVDGTAAEFNIDPVDNEDAFVGNISSVLQTLQGMVGELQLVSDPIAQYGREYMKTLPASALELGCEPDYNAYTGDVNPRPNGDTDFRTGAGHIHFGWGKGMPINHPEHMKACCILTKQLDVALGCNSVLFDDNTQRRSLYGEAGAFRPKSYGMEYRVLSNYWVGREELTRQLYRIAVKAFEDLKAGILYNRFAFEAVGGVINRSDKEAARIVLDGNNIRRVA